MALKLIQVETTNNCQSKCVFCPHSSYKEFGNMTDKLYEKILKEAAGIKTLEKFIPMGTGEPFCDPDFIERVWRAYEWLPNAKIVIYTNGGQWTEDILDELNNMNDRLYIFVSVNAMTSETRHNLMGLNDFDYVVRMIRYIDEHTNIPYSLNMVDHPLVPDREKKAFVEAGGFVIRYWSFGGKIFDYNRPEGINCPRSQHYMFVRYTGQVTLCCCDVFGEIELGNLNNQTIKQVWSSAIRHEYARAHAENRAHTMKMCKNCGGGSKKPVL